MVSLLMRQEKKGEVAFKKKSVPDRFYHKHRGEIE